MAINFSAGSTYIQTAGAFPEPAIATVTLWYKPTSVTGTNRIMGTDTNWECRLNGSDMLHEFRQNVQPNMTTVFAVNTWYHLAFTYNGTNKGAYVNGVADPISGAYAHNANGNDTALALGSSTWNLAEGMAGELEDVRIYNRVLSQKAVESIYNGNGKDGIVRGLIHWWTLNNGAQRTIVQLEPDIVGKANMSVVVGKPTYTVSSRSFLRGIN